jgi:hypothetical protein
MNKYPDYSFYLDVSLNFVYTCVNPRNFHTDMNILKYYNRHYSHHWSQVMPTWIIHDTRPLCYRKAADSLSSYISAEGTQRKLATATQPRLPRMVISLEQMLVNAVAQIEETATQLAERLETQFSGNETCPSSHNCVVAWFPGICCAVTRFSDSFVC